jgi:hypothetical protein
MGEACGKHGLEENCRQSLVGKSKRRGGYVRRRLRWEHNIKIALQWDGRV